MGNLRQKYSDEEWLNLYKNNTDYKNINTTLKLSDNIMSKCIKQKKDSINKLEKSAINKVMISSEIGVKYSDHKAPITSMLNQFNLALEAVAMRSKEGHEGKYKNVDQDWMNFKRVPNAIEHYSNGTGRHLMYLGDDEDNLGHEVATAWNALARLQLILEQKMKND